MPLSQKQMEYLAIAWQCFDTEPKRSFQIDYAKFAQVAGLASANSARELMRVTKNKLKAEYGALGGGLQSANGAGTPKKSGGSSASASTTPAPSTKKRGRKPKVAAADPDAEGEDDVEESPTKKTKKAEKMCGGKVNGAAAVKAEPVVEDEEVDGIFQ
ncbi:hypothetical protein LTR85_000899 [Meristemomyces frigidus]|nr:hypothetical protein LTR85_000899 [Meristemomyces frigidus]